jgi:Fe-S oxidoreductase
LSREDTEYQGGKVMALEDLREDMEMCSKCSICKFIPLEKVKGVEHANTCPSITKYQYNAYSGGGRMNIGVAVLENRLEYDDNLKHIIWNCQTCGACDVSCKYVMDMEVLEPIYEFRIRAVEKGATHPALDKVINSLRKQGTMVPGARGRRGDWAAGLGLKDATREKVDVLYHVGCLSSYDREAQKLARATVKILQKAGVNFGIAGENESCCGGRAYQMGYKEDFLNQAKKNMEMIRKAGVKTLVTSCADGYGAFKVLYDKFNLKGDLEVLHITEYIDRLVKESKLKPTKKVNMKVTYHDPCYLGRLGEPWIHWEGRKIPGIMRRFDPPKELRRGANGIYEPPRNVLKSIPGIKLSEMDRIKEYAWCCGAGGGVNESNPEFARWTAAQRIDEAGMTGAEAIVTACPWCIKTLNDAIKENGSRLHVYDIVELVEKAI